MPLTLIGYRGSGKSSVGRVLAGRMDWEFVDADEEIERQAGTTIARIFADEGEPGFRRREAAVMNRLLGRDRCVIAAGGGAVLSDKTRTRLAESGPVVYLQVSPETAEHRMRHDALTSQRRPSLTGLPAREEIETLMLVRERLYLECATLTLDANHGSVEAIADKILAALPADIRPEERQ